MSDCHSLLDDTFFHDVEMTLECYIHSSYIHYIPSSHENITIAGVDVNSITGNEIPYFILQHVLDKDRILDLFEGIPNDNPLPLETWLNVDIKFYCNYSQIIDVEIVDFRINTKCK